MQKGDNKQASSRRGHPLELLQKLWSQVTKLELEEFLDLIGKPSIVMCDAVKSGNTEVVKWILYISREQLSVRDFHSKGQTLLQYAVFYRHRVIVNLIPKMETVDIIMRTVDEDRNNVLHFAAFPPEESSKSPTIQMRKDLAWFKEIEKRVPPQLKQMRNKDGRTPEDEFYARRKWLSVKVDQSVESIAESSMVVAILIASVAFAAVLTVQDKKSNAWFIVFILTNAVALFTSSASIISFLSIFTSSRFKESKSIVSLPPSLILGLTLLYISIAAMVIAFTAASFLIFDHMSKWAAYVVASMVLPILLFLGVQFSLFEGLLDFYSWYRHYDPNKVQ